MCFSLSVPVCLSVFPSVYLSVFLPVFLSVCLSDCLSACLLICLRKTVSFCLPACLSYCLPTCLSACPSACLSVFLPVGLFICPSFCLSICLSVCCPVHFASQAPSPDQSYILFSASSLALRSSSSFSSAFWISSGVGPFFSLIVSLLISVNLLFLNSTVCRMQLQNKNTTTTTTAAPNPIIIGLRSVTRGGITIFGGVGKGGVGASWRV